MMATPSDHRLGATAGGPAAKRRFGDWNCPACGYLQFARNLMCRQCGAKRGAREDPGVGPTRRPYHVELRAFRDAEEAAADGESAKAAQDSRNVGVSTKESSRRRKRSPPPPPEAVADAPLLTPARTAAEALLGLLGDPADGDNASEIPAQAAPPPLAGRRPRTAA